MGAVDERPAAGELLRQRAPRCDGRRPTRRLRRLLRHDGWAGLLLAGRRRFVVADRARPAGGVVGRGPDTAMIRVVLPAHLRNLAQVDGEVVVDAEPNIDAV